MVPQETFRLIRILILIPDPSSAEPMTHRKQESEDSARFLLRSNCLYVQYLFGVETFSLLPDHQANGCDLSRQGQPGHAGSNSFA